MMRAAVCRLTRPGLASARRLSAAAAEAEEARESMEYDVVIVGAGPAGLSAAIRLKQVAGDDVQVCVLEKGAEVGNHILSGNVFEPRALDELLPNWREANALGDDPTVAAEDSFHFMYSNTKSIKIPSFLIPKTLHNHGNYVISLSQLTRFLEGAASELGVEVYPGFPASEILYDSNGRVAGVATADVGVSKTGGKKDVFARGMELRAKHTLFAEGARGSLSEQVMDKFNLRDSATDAQSYGLGIKEVWEVPKEQHSPGLIQHSSGWPLDSKTYGGSFLYHMKPNLVLCGFVVGLDYSNPYLSPYDEFQRWKHHPVVSKHLENGTCVAYGARVINEGGLQAIPKLTFPGGALIGCSAGFLNVPKIKGTHTAMKSGIVAADVLAENLEANEISEYETRLKDSWVFEELHEVRNAAPAFKKFGLYGGMLVNGILGLFTKGKEPFTWSKAPKGHSDSDDTLPASECAPISYPKADGKLSFDILTNLQRSGTYHEDDQPSHLVVTDSEYPEKTSLPKFAGPEQRFCPAKVYEYHEGKLVINAQNCVHCKTCDIKASKFIKWTVPEGGGGPSYTVT